MKAIVREQYGSPDVLRLSDVPTPTPKENEVLVRIIAAAATPSDCAFRQGDPYLIRLLYGLRRPRVTVIGTELAGEVAAVGSAVTRFRPGDAVLAGTSTSFGAYAEYVCLPEDGVIAHKPANLSFAEAAALCDGGMTAYLFLRDHANLQQGQAILINGASGAIGTAAIELARHLGAEVTAVCSAANAELVRSLGADHVIDYNREDFTATGERYDVVFDAVGKSSFSRCKRILKPEGVYLTTVPTAAIAFDMARTAFGRRKAKFAATGLSRTGEDLRELVALAEAGVIHPVMDRCYPMAATAQAHRYVDTGRKRGNVGIQIA